MTIGKLSGQCDFGQKGQSYCNQRGQSCVAKRVKVAWLFHPVRFYIPKVVIAKNIAKIAKQESSSDDSRKCLISEIVVGILIGIILMIIEQNIDLTFIK